MSRVLLTSDRDCGGRACDRPHTDPAGGLRPRDLPRMTVAEALAEWFVGHHERGGDFSRGALEAAGHAAAKAQRSGMSFSEAFEVGRTAFFSHLDREASVTTSTAEAF